jgi:streptomycin 6-kinase
MLKVANGEEERRGGSLMVWWDGEGAAEVFAAEDPAILMERLSGSHSLAAMAEGGEDDEATRILCRTAMRLHAPRAAAPPATLFPLPRWFASLWPAAETHGGTYARAAVVAHELLASPREAAVMHGDLHHDNVLDGEDRGWLVIDPKGVIGERGFEYANLFRNPSAAMALEPGRMRRRAQIVLAETGLEPRRLFQWIFAYAALGAAWSLESAYDGDAAVGIQIAEIAEVEIG